MALIECPKCGRMISDKAEKCIECGWIVSGDDFKTDINIQKPPIIKDNIESQPIESKSEIERMRKIALVFVVITFVIAIIIMIVFYRKDIKRYEIDAHFYHYEADESESEARDYMDKYQKTSDVISEIDDAISDGELSKYEYERIYNNVRKLDKHYSFYMDYSDLLLKKALNDMMDDSLDYLEKARDYYNKAATYSIKGDEAYEKSKWSIFTWTGQSYEAWNVIAVFFIIVMIVLLYMVKQIKKLTYSKNKVGGE